MFRSSLIFVAASGWTPAFYKASAALNQWASFFLPVIFFFTCYFFFFTCCCWLFVCLRQELTLYPWQTWNSGTFYVDQVLTTPRTSDFLCSPSFKSVAQTHKPTCLSPTSLNCAGECCLDPVLLNFKMRQQGESHSCSCSTVNSSPRRGEGFPASAFYLPNLSARMNILVLFSAIWKCHDHNSYYLSWELFTRMLLNKHKCYQFSTDICCRGDHMWQDVWEK